VPGICNETTGLCICPEGYNGVDDFEVFNDCHIQINIRLYIRYGLIALSVFQSLFALFSMLYLFRRRGSTFFWIIDTILNECSEERRRMLQKRREELLDKRKNSYDIGSGTYITEIPVGVDEDDKSASLFSELEEELELEIAKQQEFAEVKKEKKKRKKDNKKQETLPTLLQTPKKSGAPPRPPRPLNLVKDGSNALTNTSKNLSFIDTDVKLLRETNRRATILTAMFLNYGIANLVYQVYFIYVNEIDSRAENNPYQNFSLGFCVGSIVGGFWYLVYLWYRSLPELTVYGRLFGLSNLFIKYNYLVKWISLFFVILSFAVFLLFLFLMPAVEPTQLRRWNDATMWSIAVLVVAAELFLTFVVLMLLKVYNSSLEALDIRKKSIQLQKETADDANQEKSEQNNMEAPFKIQIIKKANVNDSSLSLNVEKSILEKESDIMKARRTQLALLGFTWFGTCCCLGLIVGSLYVDFLSSNYYIFFTTLSVVASFAAIFLNYMVVFRGLRKENRGTSNRL